MRPSRFGGSRRCSRLSTCWRWGQRGPTAPVRTQKMIAPLHAKPEPVNRSTTRRPGCTASGAFRVGNDGKQLLRGGTGNAMALEHGRSGEESNKDNDANDERYRQRNNKRTYKKTNSAKKAKERRYDSGRRSERTYIWLESYRGRKKREKRYWYGGEAQSAADIPAEPGCDRKHPNSGMFFSKKD